MINGITSYSDSADVRYLERQINCLSPERFSGCKRSLLVLGSGDGEALNKLAALHGDWQFTGVDFNETYIEQSKKSAPANVNYINADFRELATDQIFGVIGSCGLLSWIEEDAVSAVFSLLTNNLEHGGYASFGFDNQFFWSELIPIRELFLSCYMETESVHVAKMTTLTVVKSMSFSSSVKREVALDMINNEENFRHWLMQPVWKPFFPSEIIGKMRAAGLELTKGASLMDLAIENATLPQPYIHWEFKKV